MSRTVTRTMHYSKYRKFQEDIHSIMRDYVIVKKGEYKPNNKEITINITFIDIFFEPRFTSTIFRLDDNDDAARVLQKFSNTPDENIVFYLEGVELLCDIGMTDSLISQYVLNPSDLIAEKYISKFLDNGTLEPEYVDPVREFRNKYFVML